MKHVIVLTKISMNCFQIFLFSHFLLFRSSLVIISIIVMQIIVPKVYWERVIVAHVKTLIHVHYKAMDVSHATADQITLVNDAQVCFTILPNFIQFAPVLINHQFPEFSFIFFLTFYYFHFFPFK